MLWSFRLFLALFIPFVAAAADHHLLDGALGQAVGGLMPWTGF